MYGKAAIQAQKLVTPNRQTDPHVYGIAHDAFESLLFDNSNNAILISGESGAGKTEATKKVLEYLAESAYSETHVERKVLLANPILEALGNAQTSRNHNSSRFGKWIEIHVDQRKRSITGASITPYLLERSRVVFQAKGDNNFHIFYMLLGNQAYCEEHHLDNKKQANFRYLMNYEVEQGESDAGDLMSVFASMAGLGFEPEEQEWMLHIIIAVLHLGNVDFEQGGQEHEVKPGTAVRGGSHASRSAGVTGSVIANRRRKVTGSRFAIPPSLGGDKKQVSRSQHASFRGFESMQVDTPRSGDKKKPKQLASFEQDPEEVDLSGRHSLNQAAHYLGLSSKALEQVLCTRSITVRGEKSTIPLDPDEARDGVDSLAMAMYSRLFFWVVDKINEFLGASHGKGKFIGVLDIFGFEIFEKNSFEQLCINYANEKLQQQFNSSMFKEEEGLYVFEGISFKHIEFIDNVGVLDLIEKTPDGLLLMLDDECRAPGGSDQRFSSKMEKKHQKNQHFFVDQKARFKNSHAFEVKHYAGRVNYDATGFVQANTDTISYDVQECCANSGSRLTAALYQDMLDEQADEEMSFGGDGFKKKKKAKVGV